jgi:hypothetical protein
MLAKIARGFFGIHSHLSFAFGLYA